ncbi:MAG TPA: phage tail protein [Bacillota bacterium]|nr:phage tail protein [Bacillota bacterium]
MDPLKYFVFNKEEDFQRGFSHNVEYTAHGLQIAPGSLGEGGVFYSRVLDSRARETEWHRLTVRRKSLGDASIRFTFYASEGRTLQADGQETDLEDFLRDSGRSLKEKEEALRHLKVKTSLNPEDILLHEIKGRYLWFRIELFGQGEESPKISHMKIYLPKQSWLGYLPEVYQSDPKSRSFTERYLNLFQSLYSELEQKIDGVAAYFDPDVAEGEFMQWLAGWLDIEDGYIWNEEQLRHLIKNGVRMYQMRGTRRGVSDMVELYLGERPYIVENFQLEGSEGEIKTGGLLARLYGDSSYYFTVVVPERCVPSVKEHKTLLKIIESAKPAHMEANVVVLKPYIFLNKYSYLGMNSVLNQYRPANLDGFSALAFANVSADTEIESDQT